MDGDEVEVSVSITQPMQVLSLASIGSLTVTGHGSAIAAYGVDGATGP